MARVWLFVQIVGLTLALGLLVLGVWAFSPLSGLDSQGGGW